MRVLKGTAVCRLTPRGIAIDLRLTGFRSRVAVIDIPFVDIDELRTYTYIEAATFAELGPNTNDLNEFFKGRLARPRLLHLVHSLGTTLLIRGRDLFYLVTVDRAGLFEIIDAHADFRSRAPLPPHGAAVPPSPSQRSGASMH